jgi:hypothetical protein
MILLKSLGIFQLTLSKNRSEILAEEQRHIVSCVDNIVHHHLLPRKSLRVSLPPVDLNVTSPTLTHTLLQEYNFNMVDTFLRIVTEGARWSVELSRIGATQSEIMNEYFYKHDSYIIFTAIHNEESYIISSVSEQLEELQRAGSWNYRARFVVVTSVHINVSIQEMAFKILEEMWKYYSVMDLLIAMSVSNFRFNDTVGDSSKPEGNKSEIDIQLFSWFPYTSPTQCDKLKEAVLVDRWNSDGQFVLKVNLFQEKVPKTFHKCSTKIISFINPPAVTENYETNSHKPYTGFEVNFVEIIFKRLNLTVSPHTRDPYYRMFMHTIGQLERASSDIAIGGLPLHTSTIHFAETTIPHVYSIISWYVPCPYPAPRWKSMYKIFGSLVWVCFSVVAILAVIIMWLLARYETQIHVRESENYMTIIYCIYNVWAVLTAVSVPQKPISLSLRIFFTAWVWYSFAMTTVYQAYFIGFLVNPGFEKSITTLKELTESGIDYGYPVEMNNLTFSDPLYKIITKNRKICKSAYKCLQRVIERKDFATILDNFRAEYFRTRLLFHNIHVPVCTLQEDVTMFMASIYMAKGNPLLRRFNEIITRMFEAGIIENWWKDFMYSLRLDDHPISDDDTNLSDFATNELNTYYSTFSLVHLHVVFHILLTGQIFSIFVSLVEVLYYRTCVTAATNTKLYRVQRNHVITTR